MQARCRGANKPVGERQSPECAPTLVTYTHEITSKLQKQVNQSDSWPGVWLNLFRGMGGFLNAFRSV
jgi:hypothetical protein